MSPDLATRVVTRWCLGINKMKMIGEIVLGESNDGVPFDGRFRLALSMPVKTMMMKGHKVILTIKSTHSNEEGDSLPHNSTLQISTLELLSWTKIVSQVTVDKKVVKKRKGFDCCSNDGAVVKLKLIIKLQDGTENDGEAELFEFKTNDAKQMIDELDRAVSTMKKGDVALLIIEPEYSFGSSESRHELDVVPPNLTLDYDVEQVSILENKGSWNMMSVAEKLQVSRKKHERYHPPFLQPEHVKIDNSRLYEVDSSGSKVWPLKRDCILTVDPRDENLFGDELNSIDEKFRKLCRIEKEKNKMHMQTFMEICSTK
ncbi:hypothetical protein TSUD_201230 [Trifolium subterraneum]|uniref:peptidylprolyl isomerase n=1 Tax=Trifolium subterraneum TaxID=3900 RepID=A0A2Z6LQ76_TRISU|nr:hypothetical protein TSUD_201230 [Trifolium subterraneum]